MNILAHTFHGAAPVLPHITWPIPPHEDESLAGYVARACAHNGLWNPKVLVADAGLHLPKGVGYLPRVSRNLSKLATLLAADPGWIALRRHQPVEKPGGRRALSIGFHGATLRRAHLYYASPRITPTAMRRHEYHREMWHIGTLGACPNTSELLLEKCQDPHCGRSLAWAGANGVIRCSDPGCEGKTSAVAELIPVEIRASYLLVASLINPCPETHDHALQSLPACLRNENRGDVFELAWLLGCLDHCQNLVAIKSPMSLVPLERCKILAQGACRLQSWPSCLGTVLRDCVAQRDGYALVPRVVSVLRTIVRKPATFGRPAAMLAKELGGITTNGFLGVVGKHLGLVTATQFGRDIGLATSKTAKLLRSKHVAQISFSAGHRNIALLSPADAQNIRHRVQHRLTFQSLATAMGIGIDAVELLVQENVLELADDPILQELWPGQHLNLTVSTELRDAIRIRAGRGSHPVDSIPLWAALRGCAAGDKPWPEIISAVLTGEITLYHRATQRMHIRSCLISPADTRLLQSFRRSGVSPSLRSTWLTEEDARERLSTSSKNVIALVKAKRLAPSGKYSGQTYRRSQVDVIARGWMSTLELQAKLGLPLRRHLSAALRAADLFADEQGFVRRGEAFAKLGFHLF